MTKQEAKAIALEKLQYFETLPSDRREYINLPDHIMDKIKTFHNLCPLCELFCYAPKDGESCGECPLVCPHCNNRDDGYLLHNIKRIQAWEATDDQFPQ
jgi:7-cyano-7-deazaguanine synthase in queuosine biosynthesis